MQLHSYGNAEAFEYNFLDSNWLSSKPHNPLPPWTSDGQSRNIISIQIHRHGNAEAFEYNFLDSSWLSSKPHDPP